LRELVNSKISMNIAFLFFLFLQAGEIEASQWVLALFLAKQNKTIKIELKKSIRTKKKCCLLYISPDSG
jgi:hypothetical protein